MATSPRPAHTISELPTILDAFAASWTVLARLFTGVPQQQAIDSLREMAPQWPLSADAGPTRRGIRLLQASARTQESADDVRRDAQRLFVGPGHLQVPPYESVHLNSSGLVFEEETLEVRAFYRRFGLQHERLGKEPDDHIALELEFLSTLALRALDGLEAHEAALTEDADAAAMREEGQLPAPTAEHVQAIGEFLERHALLWHYRFGELVVEQAQTQFLQGVGSLLMGAAQEAREVFVQHEDAR